MQTEDRRKPQPKFPLRLMPSVRREAEALASREGVSLNQFINVAVAEKLAHLQHEEWLKRRKPYTREMQSEALTLLDTIGSEPPQPGDELPVWLAQDKLQQTAPQTADQSEVHT